MTPERIVSVGQTLYGGGWIDGLCADACWSRRFVERIANGKNEAPGYFVDMLVYLLAARIASLAELRRKAEGDRRDRFSDRIRELDAALDLLKP